MTGSKQDRRACVVFRALSLSFVFDALAVAPLKALQHRVFRAAYCRHPITLLRVSGRVSEQVGELEMAVERLNHKRRIFSMSIEGVNDPFLSFGAYSSLMCR